MSAKQNDFSVLVDNITDVSRIEQLSWCIRYLDTRLIIEKIK